MAVDQQTQDLTDHVHDALCDNGLGVLDAETVLGAELTTGRIDIYWNGRAYTLRVEADDA